MRFLIFRVLRWHFATGLSYKFTGNTDATPAVLSTYSNMIDGTKPMPPDDKNIKIVEPMPPRCGGVGSFTK